MPTPADDVFAHIRAHVAGWTPRLVFDVGANKGQSVKSLATRFPECTFHSFEPGPQAYRKLVKSVSSLTNVVTHNIALGRAEATLDLELGIRTTLSRLVAESETAERATVKVKVRPGADVFREMGAERIDFLKIDTEGHDHEVLTGFLPVIAQVDFVQVEAAMNPHNKTHVPLGQFQQTMWGGGFHLYHIFEQTMEWKQGGRPVLRRCNPVFINGRLLSLDGIS